MSLKINAIMANKTKSTTSKAKLTTSKAKATASKAKSTASKAKSTTSKAKSATSKAKSTTRKTPPKDHSNSLLEEISLEIDKESHEFIEKLSQDLGSNLEKQIEQQLFPLLQRLEVISRTLENSEDSSHTSPQDNSEVIKVMKRDLEDLGELVEDLDTELKSIKVLQAEQTQKLDDILSLLTTKN